MKKLVQFLEAKLGSKLANRKVLLVPGEVFYCHSLTLPPEISDSEIDQFAELSLEGLSPFPLDQLLWGFLRDEKTSLILIYAAYRESINKLGVENLDQYYHVLPSFITINGVSFDEPSITFLSENNSMSALTFSAHSTVPENVFTLSLENIDNSDASLLKVKNSLLVSLKNEGYKIDNNIYLGTSALVDSDDKLRFKHRLVSGEIDSDLNSTVTRLPMDEKKLWDADIRASSFKLKASRKRNYSRYVWSSTQLAGIAASLFLLLQFIFMMTNTWTDFRIDKVAERSDEVALIEQKNNLLLRIEQIAQNELKPFEMLATMNLKRPSSIYFTQAVSDSFNQIQVDGAASNVEVVNRYMENLRNLPLVSDAKIKKIVSRSGNAPFTVVVTFNPSPFNPKEIVAGAQLME